MRTEMEFQEEHIYYTDINLLSYSMSIARTNLFEILVELGSAQALLFKAKNISFLNPLEMVMLNILD